MMSIQTDTEQKLSALLDEVVDWFKALYERQLSSVILYGSYARGDFDMESDIDIIVLVDDDDIKKHRDALIDFEVDLTVKYGIMPSILVENKDFFSKRKNIEYLFQNVVKEGRIIYAA